MAQKNIHCRFHLWREERIVQLLINITIITSNNYMKEHCHFIQIHVSINKTRKISLAPKRHRDDDTNYYDRSSQAPYFHHINYVSLNTRW